MIKIIRNFALAWRWYCVTVLGVTLLSAGYLWLLCSDRYVSDAKVIVEEEGSSSAQAIDLGLFSVGSSSSSMDAYVVKSFIESQAMLGYLEERLGLREHFSQEQADWLSRLPADASEEKFLKYYLGYVEVLIDETSLIIEIKVQGFDREFAHQLASTIVERAETFINDIGQTLARSQVAFVQNELQAGNERLQKASRAMVELQNQTHLVSPQLESEAVSQVVASLQQQLATQRTELKALLGYLSASAPEVVATRKKINAIEQQIAQERAKQVGQGASPALNAMLLDYKEVELDLQIAQDIYQTGLQTLETAKLDASRKVKHLVSVSPPSHPDQSMEPRRFYLLASIFIALNVLYFIASLLIATIKDHQE